MNYIFGFFIVAVTTLLAHAAGEIEKTVDSALKDGRSIDSTVLTKRLFSVSASGATAESVIRMIAQKSGMSAKIDGDLSQRVSYNFADTTLENALQQMSSDVGFDYSIREGVIFVSKSSGKSGGGSQRAQLLELRYMDAEEMSQKLKTFVGPNDTIHVDKKLNSIVFVGSDSNFRRAKAFVELFDRMPQQILIEAKIVETNDSFSREIGFLVGDQGGGASTGSTTTGAATALDVSTKVTGYSSPQRSTTPIFGMKYKIGSVAGRDLDLRLLAAEAKGDAKVISKPKVVTINNTRALINSGLTLSVKTLSSVQAGGSSTGSNVAGGLERVEAGLQLGVLPSVLDTSLVRLVVDVNNSQPDSQIAVDGIPAVSTNSANTSVIVEDGATAVIAGLIKNSDSNSRSGVPFLSDIPILGLLFRSDGKVTKNNEMIILITPKILNKQLDAPAERATASVQTEK